MSSHIMLLQTLLLLLFVASHRTSGALFRFAGVTGPVHGSFDTFFACKNGKDSWEVLCEFLSEKFSALFHVGLGTCKKFVEETTKRASEQQVRCEGAIADTKNINLFLKPSFVRSHTSTMSAYISTSLSLASQYASLSNANDWDFVGEDANVKVWKCKTPLSDCTESTRWPCVKAQSVIDAPPEAIMRLLMDSSRIHLINKYSIGRVDVEQIDQRTKVVWNRSKIPLFSISYDICLLMHCHKAVNDNSYIIVTRSIDHPQVPPHKHFSRAETYLGVTILVPKRSDPTKTEMITINHARLPGFHPFLASRNFFRGAVNYLKQLQTVAPDIREE